MTATNEFIQLIHMLETEIGHAAVPGALAYTDKNHDNAWSDATDEVEKELVRAQKLSDIQMAKKAANKYRVKIKGFIAQYRRERVGAAMRAQRLAKEARGGNT